MCTRSSLCFEESQCRWHRDSLQSSALVDQPGNVWSRCAENPDVYLLLGLVQCGTAIVHWTLLASTFQGLDMSDCTERDRETETDKQADKQTDGHTYIQTKFVYACILLLTAVSCRLTWSLVELLSSLIAGSNVSWWSSDSVTGGLI